jgi:hypothetical protein
MRCRPIAEPNTIASTMAVPMPRQPHMPFRQVALQHRLVRMQRIVIDGDDGVDRIFGDGFGDLEISAILAEC